jgi:hypothetical protein
MSLFKIISSFSHRHITAQVKYAGLQNGFRILSENREPLIGKDGSLKVFFCCHHKPNKCIFRLQYTKRGQSEPFRFYKGRDLHNHDFVEPTQLLKESSTALPSPDDPAATLIVHNSADLIGNSINFV